MRRMTYDVALRAYCRSVGGALRLKKQQKQEILKGLRQELEEHFSGAETLTLEEINAEIGVYDKVANELMESVPLKERERYLTRQKWGSRIAIITFALLFVASVVFFIHMAKSQVASIEETIIIESVRTIDNTMIEGE